MVKKIKIIGNYKKLNKKKKINKGPETGKLSHVKSDLT
jgi:hypothetical protein